MRFLWKGHPESVDKTSKVLNRNLVALFILSVLIASCGKSLVNMAVDSLMPDRTVIITSLPQSETPNEIWFFDNSDDNNLFTSCRYGEQTGIWEYREATTYGYGGNMIVHYGDDAASLSFSVPVSPNSYIMFWKNINSGSVLIESDGHTNQLDLKSGVEGGELMKVYPFQNSILPVMVRVVVYFVLCALAFAVLIMTYIQLAYRKRHMSFLCSDAKWFYIFPIWIALYIFAVMQYKAGIPNFLEFGDQVYYWRESLLHAGSWSTEYLAQALLSFRGYLCNFFPTVAQVAGQYIHVDPVHIYFIFTSGAIAWLVTFVLPGLYKLLTGKTATLHQVTMSLLIYLFFWNGTLTAVLADLFGATAFLSGILFAFRLAKERKIRFACLTGFFWAAACNFRTAYQYGIYVLLAFALLWGLIMMVRRRKANKTYGENEGKKVYVNALACVAATVSVFLLVSFPQLQINMSRGHAGFLPYDYAGAWPIATPTQSLLEWSANHSLDTAYTGYPYMVSDAQMLTMEREAGYQETAGALTIQQILEVYANSPLDSLTYVIKKMFLAFDAKTSVSYPEGVHWRESSGFVYSLLNYFVLGSALYVLFCGKSVKKGERMLAGLLFVGLVLPQMFVHVEWRYFLASYILLYFFFVYHFVGELSAILAKEQTEGLGYLPYICIVLCAAFTISLTIHA